MTDIGYLQARRSVLRLRKTVPEVSSSTVEGPQQYLASMAVIERGGRRGV